MSQCTLKEFLFNRFSSFFNIITIDNFILTNQFKIECLSIDTIKFLINSWICFDKNVFQYICICGS